MHQSKLATAKTIIDSTNTMNFIIIVNMILFIIIIIINIVF